jgi:pyrimidine nucleoside transport protein
MVLGALLTHCLP